MINKPQMKIAIASGKGGTGKTLIASNFAALLSKKYNTLLVDLDVEEPNDFIFIKGICSSEELQYKMIPEWIESKCTLCGICSKVCKFHAVVQLGNHIAVFKQLCHSCYACSELCPYQALPMQKQEIGVIKTINSGNLLFIESRLNVGEEQAVPLIKKTHEIINNKHQNIAIQIFDCPPGTSCPVIAATKDADFVVLVTEPTPFGLNDLMLAVDTMKEIKKPIGVVINRYGIGNQLIEDYCKKEQIPILAMIPFDRQIAEFYSKGELIFDKMEIISNSLYKMFDSINNLIKKHE